MHTQSCTNTSYTNEILNTLLSFQEEKVALEKEDQAPEASGRGEGFRDSRNQRRPSLYVSTYIENKH